ncbi:N-acetylmuramoyl-L-alanine amidase family protein [Algicella marina]|uniref:N-acetylmuramoyl-L-alanine amidase n=1 Tax=Algicella marina TaxID=2683284 RepID=A0A6P1SYF0_9RHOB|nr:N-acetylmuramoyl-L-alanine amidase [Algicella marina]QHQ34650.1 N-acetylmuramoyl-L-alanine amidase [Algicella marina]
MGKSFRCFAVTAMLCLWPLVLAAGPQVRPGSVTLTESFFGLIRLEIGLTDRAGYRVTGGRFARVDLSVDGGVPKVSAPAGMSVVARRGPEGKLRMVLRTGTSLALLRSSYQATANGPVLLLEFTRQDDSKPQHYSDEGDFLVMLDPGHGGIDPGAVRAGVSEKDIALKFAGVLAETLRDAGYSVAMTRKTDVFLRLDARVSAAREAEADLFLSLHANTVTKGVASGPTLYVLSGEPSDADAAAVAEFENSADRLAGYDPASGEDDVTDVLRDLAFRAAGEASRDVAREIIGSLSQSVGVIRSRPLRSANFRVLKAPDIPSVLIELGFLGHAGDRARMQDPDWQALAATAVRDGVEEWRAAVTGRNIASAGREARKGDRRGFDPSGRTAVD